VSHELPPQLPPGMTSNLTNTEQSPSSYQSRDYLEASLDDGKSGDDSVPKKYPRAASVVPTVGRSDGLGFESVPPELPVPRRGNDIDWAKSPSEDLDCAAHLGSA
jgi:hypothetical protein